MMQWNNKLDENHGTKSHEVGISNDLGLLDGSGGLGPGARRHAPLSDGGPEPLRRRAPAGDRKSVGEGKSVDLGGRPII